MDRLKIERYLARAVRKYLQERNEELYPDLSTGLERLLQWHWQARGTSEGRCFDGVVEPTLRVHPPHRMEVGGLMVWMDGRPVRMWVDVFWADMTLSVDRDTFDRYTLRFCRKGMEDRTISYENRLELRRELGAGRDLKWAFIFTNAKETP